MPVERAGDSGPAAPPSAANPPASRSTSSTPRTFRGPKRTPRPDAGLGLAGAPLRGPDRPGDGTQGSGPAAAPGGVASGAVYARTEDRTPTGARFAGPSGSPAVAMPARAPAVARDGERLWATEPADATIPGFNPAVPSQVPVPAPHQRPADGRERRGRRGRRVNRVVRRIELWSVLKLALVLYTCLYLAVLATLIAVWGLAYSSGQVENLQKFLADVGLENYRFYGDQMFRACAAIGAVAVLAGTVVTVLTAALVNIVSEITGGIRLIVIEEEPVARR